ncbi:uncharacterized protein LOC106151382 [Lingula anatina]|uniref:Uncharacterized protein LOC106151382 n=1 Tax=Lingula anatina TaxID=7574 RepID=A0A1S3H3M0_LINAN|nr:uncharacterized protein LOC106151382 [Lingula anatina]|eukprot:XP_013380066.1 uncharacterized protein LOC106151382 [Lingula anatina]
MQTFNATSWSIGVCLLAVLYLIYCTGLSEASYIYTGEEGQALNPLMEPINDDLNEPQVLPINPVLPRSLLARIWPQFSREVRNGVYKKKQCKPGLLTMFGCSRG